MDLPEDEEKNFDQYATRKSNSQNFLNVSLILSIVSTIIKNTNTPNKYDNAVIAVGSSSIGLQLILSPILVVLAASNKNVIGTCCGHKITCIALNNIVTVLSGVLPILSGILLLLENIN